MKKILVLISLLLIVAMSLVLVSCDDSTTPPPSTDGGTSDGGTSNGGTSNGGTSDGGTSDGGTSDGGTDTTPAKTITGVTFRSNTYTYDGTQKALTVNGTLPTGVSVAYTGNVGTDAGTYSATAVLSGDGYTTLTLYATLTINKATITGIGAEAEQTLDADGENHLPVYTGTLPAGVSVQYKVDGADRSEGVSAIGTYAFQLIFSGANYESLTLPVSYRLALDPIKLATSVVNAFGSTPDPWALLPDGFSAENHTISAVPSYDNFVNVSNIPVNGIGKQMNVAYGLLNKTSVALSYVNTVMGYMDAIKSLYTAYLDTDPTDYQNYTGNAGPFTFELELSADSYALRATVSSVLVEIYSDLADGTYGATVKLTETTVLKYTVSEDALLIAMDVLDTVAVQIQFTEDEDGNVIGHLYEYLVAGDRQLTATSAMIEVGEDYTVVIGTKGDFIPTSVSRNCEIYDNETGRLVGTEVREDTDLGLYNTYWFPLAQVQGINSIKKVDEENLPNPDTIYINGIGDTAISTKILGPTFGLKKTGSRRYDIEFKTVYGYVYNTDTKEYEEVKYEIPMLFVQEEVIATFESDFEDKNSSLLDDDGVTLLIALDDFNAIERGYEVLLPLYDATKDAVTYQMITDYCKE